MCTSKFDLVKLDGILKRDFFVALAIGRTSEAGDILLSCTSRFFLDSMHQVRHAP